ncbi:MULTISPECIES: NAD(P)H-quinone oxidoreductase [Arthrobacter]|uniref:NAD(P)H-quinone oxidoreductase n=2 Tax=Arthrobacter TaxID=1663 RepID=A0ABU9KIB3_9MICC|nr:NAD(P)H-quinone oxidoreductase [Arthrobacter sp. YJM1]MDP5226673.1 NAD(P)H-quinone oxidoreductase [Arthrobacter sp. YJM1]
MRAVQITAPGEPEVLQLSQVPDPVPGPGELLIDVVAAGLNRADVQQRRGHYPPPAGASEIPGLEVSGRIAGFGPGVTRPFSVGDKVVALLAGGGYAEKVVVPAGHVLRVPDGVDLVTAAGLPEVAATIYSNLYMTAGLRREETLLVHGATGGIGTFAIQLAKALGSTVATTAGGPEKVATARGFLGADIAIDYQAEDFPEALREATGGRGADVILDVVGAKYLGKNLDALNTHGRLVVIGLQGGARGELDLGKLLSKRAAVIGTTLRARPDEEKTAIMDAVREVVWPLITDGSIRPLVARSFPLQDVAEAHRYFETGQHVGKILLTM